MKTIIQNLLGAMLLLAVSLQTHAQSTLVYDQQSTNPPSLLGDYLNIQEDSPLLQSFVPTLSTIGFVQFEFWDIPGNGNNGATVYVNLWTGSPSIRLATLLGSTSPVYMPNGFGSSSVGVTNFCFSLPIALTPGQTYYLQPVVSSGDDPWDVWAPGDTYPNGQLYSTLGGVLFPVDLWFREGVAVPEPNALALLGSSGLLVFSINRRSKPFAVFLAVLLFAFLILPAHASNDSVVQATAEEAGLSPATGLPPTGTFWVITSTPNGHLVTLPYPSLPPDLSALPIYSVSGNTFIVDSTGGQLSTASMAQGNRTQMTAIALAQSQDVASLITGIEFPTNSYGTNGYYQPNDYQPVTFTTGLWLEVLNTNRVATNLLLRLHGTVNGDYYQMLSTSDLTYTAWDLGEIVNAYDTNADFSRISGTNTMKFYRAHHANPIMEISMSQHAIEPNPTNDDPGQVGNFYIWNEGKMTNDVTVYYHIGGTAQDGVDYSNLTGTVIVSNNQGYAEVDIAPIADGLKPDQTVILTLTQNTNCLIDPAYYSATNILYANPEVVPTAYGDNERLCPNAPLTINLSSDASDPRNLPLTYTILTWPTNGTLDTSSIPYITYTSTNCFEGVDNFTFTVSDGQYTSAVAAVTLIVADTVYANAVSVQTCRNTPVGFTLNGGDNCGESLSYVVLSRPLSGTLSGTPPNLIYKPNSASFTGTDSFSYAVFGECGNAATNLVTITVGDQNISGVSQTTVTGTNQPVSLVLTAVSNGSCDTDTNDYLYSIVNPPTSGTLSGTPPNLIYTPTNDFEGQDSFQFTAGDGVWTSSPATVTIDVVAGPILFRDCNPFSTGVALDWVLDPTVRAMQQTGLGINDFIIYRSVDGGKNFVAIATNFNTAGWMNYIDTNIVVGQTNYYVVTFEAYDSAGILHDSPFSNEIEASAQNSGLIITATNFWNVVTNLNAPNSVTNWQTPFSSYGTNQYPGLLPLPNTYWPVGTTWSNYVAMVIPSNSVPLSQVTYSIAIDNDYQLYLNESTAPIETFNHEDFAVWSPFKSFESIAPGLLHYGTNSLRVVIADRGGVNYFSMMVSTNDCRGQ